MLTENESVLFVILEESESCFVSCSKNAPRKWKLWPPKVNFVLNSKKVYFICVKVHAMLFMDSSEELENAHDIL